MTQPIRPPKRHRIYFTVEAVLIRFLLRMTIQSRYVCPACLKLDHEHCEGANGRWSLCQCDDPDPLVHAHAHPHNPSNYWPYPGATRPVEGEYDPELADPELAEVYSYADELLESGNFSEEAWEERLHIGVTPPEGD